MKIFTALNKTARLQDSKVASALFSPPRRLAASSPAQGFTLLELLVSIALMSILAGISIPGLYGAYLNQQMLNTANEIIAGAQVARAKALANFQGTYATNPPQADCTSTTPYVDLYSFAIGADNQSYVVTQGFRAADASNNSCAQPNPLPAPVYSRTIPSPITVASSNGGTVALPLTFKTTSGKSNLGPADVAQVDLLANGLLGNKHLYVCIKQSSMYVQDSAC